MNRPSLQTLKDENDKIMAETSDKTYTKSRHHFFLKPYEDVAFTKCPKCEGKNVTYDLKPDRNDPTAVGSNEMADAIIEKIRN